jgi:NHL repeat
VRFLAASTGAFYGQAMSAGDIYTIAGTGKAGFGGDGGPATAAELNSPDGVAVDASGDVAIGDEESNRVRLLAAHDGAMFNASMHAGDIYTVAGIGTRGFSGDGGPATAAQLFQPGAVAFDAAGDLLVSDEGNNRVRIVYGGTVPSGPPPPCACAPPGGPAGKPVLGGVRQSHAVWREGSKLARIARHSGRLPVGTTFTFTLDLDATVTLRFTQRRAGRRQGRRCVARNRHNAAHRHCTRTVTVATLTLPAHRGDDSIAFQGRVSRSRKLRPGRYTVVIRASDAAGFSAARTLTFTIMP